MKKLVLCLIVAASVAFAVPAGKDLTGKWTFNVDTSAGPGTPSFTFKQDGEKVTGDYQGQLGAAKVTGTNKDGKFEIKFTIDQLGEVVYSGEFTDDNSLKGKVKLGEMGEGTFTGKRADK